MSENNMCSLLRNEGPFRNKLSECNSVESRHPVSSKLLQLENKIKKKRKGNLVKKEPYLHTCECCGITLHTPSSARTHSRIHTQEKLSSCNITFKQEQLSNPNDTHLSTNVYKCELCQEAFTTKLLFNSHMKVHNTIKDDKCVVCSAVFLDKKQLMVHLKKHDKNCFKCSECGDTFLTSHRLKRHFMIHTGERPYQCEECGVPFREYTTLKSHMGTHLSRGPYPCEVCGEEFVRLNSLTLHKRVHNTNGAYEYITLKMGKLHPTNKKTNMPVMEEHSPKECSLQEQNLINDQVINAGCTLSPKESAAPGSFSSMQSKKGPELNPSLSSVTQLTGDIGGDILTEMEEDMLSVPHSDVVQDILATGTVLESQGDDGQGYLIVLPKALAEKDYTLITFPPVSAQDPSICEDLVLSENEDLGANNCDLLVWNNEIDAMTDIPFEPEKDLFYEKQSYRPLKAKKYDLSADENVTEDLTLKKSLRTLKKEKKVKDVKVRINKSYVCQHCEKDCKTSSALNTHLRIHTGERPYFCDYCNRGFKQLAHLKSHVRIHSGERPFKCELCDATFTQSCRLKSHQKTHTQIKIKEEKIEKPSVIRNFYCKICNKTFLDSCYKKQHMKTHVYDNKYNCVKCNVHFKSKNSLRKHCRNHVDGNWGVCEECGLQFQSIEILQIHMKMSHGRNTVGLHNMEAKDKDERHDSVREIVIKTESVSYSDCNLEQNVYPSRSEPVVHNTYPSRSEPVMTQSRHQRKTRSCKSGPKSHNCHICKKTFKQSSNLYTHMRMHTGERPFKCNFCSSAFRQISHLKDHVKMHTGDKPFMCSACPAAFSQSSGAKYHNNRCHDGKAHVVKELKTSPQWEEESIILLEVPQVLYDTVTINVYKDMSVSVEYQFEKVDVESEVVKNDENAQSVKYREHGNIYAHKCKRQKKFMQRCKICNLVVGIAVSRTQGATGKEEHQIMCKRCTMQGNVSMDLESIPALTYQDEMQEESVKEIIRELIFCDSKENIDGKDFMPISSNKNSAESVQKFWDLHQHISFEEDKRCALYGGKCNMNELSREKGNVCDICGKMFRRASALKFHKSMSHRNDFEEDIEEEDSDPKWETRNGHFDAIAKQNVTGITKRRKQLSYIGNKAYNHKC